MLTSDALRNMSDQDRAQLFWQLAEQHYKNGIPLKLAQDFGVHAKTVEAWRREPHRIPWPVIMVLSHWTDSGQAAIERLRTISESLRNIGDGMAGVAKDLAQLAKEVR